MPRKKIGIQALVDNRRNYEKERRESLRKEANEIGEIPPVVNSDRRAICEADPILWLKTYLADEFFLDFTSEQKEFILDAWEAIKKNHNIGILAPRGFGKTTCEQGLLLNAFFQGIHKCGMYIVAEGNKTKEASEWFRAQLEENEMLAEDYPEICYPIKIRDGVAQKPLHQNNVRCQIVISPEYIKFPTIIGSQASGSIIKFASIFSSGIRGSKFHIRGVGSFRPTIAMVDDVQSDGTAKSELEVGKIMEVITKTIAMLGGTDRSTKRKVRTAMIMALTQNQPNDVAVRCMKKPELFTKVYRFFKRLPDDFSAWRAYKLARAEIYTTAQTHDEAIERMNIYYLKHREQIDAGCIVANEEIFTIDDISAIQFGLNTWCNSLVAFWCELQNDAERAYTEDGGFLTPTIVLRKVIDLPRLTVPEHTVTMTAFVDVGEHYHNFEVMAIGEEFSFLHTVNFGVWPEQKVAMVTKKNYHVDLQSVYDDGKSDVPAMVRKSISDCLQYLMRSDYVYPNGDPVPIHDEIGFKQNAMKRNFKFFSAIGVDAQDFDVEGAVWNAISDFHRSEEKFFGRAIPCYGQSASNRLFRYLPLKEGEWRRGAGTKGECDWIENPDTKKQTLSQHLRAVPACLKYDPNTYRKQRDDAWLMAPNRIGTHTLFNDKPEWLVMFANQQCAMEYVPKRINEYDYRAYQVKQPAFADKEFFDTDTGCVMLGSYVGVESPAIVVRRPAKVRISRAEYERVVNERLQGRR